MNDLAVHVLLFLVAAAVIVVMSAFYTHAEDGPALRSLPRRYAVFVLSCGAVVLVMLILQWVFVDVG